MILINENNYKQELTGLCVVEVSGESCALGQLRDFSIFTLLTDSFDIIQHSAPFVKGFFIIFQKLIPPVSGRDTTQCANWLLYSFS